MSCLNSRNGTLNRKYGNCSTVYLPIWDFNLRLSDTSSLETHTDTETDTLPIKDIGSIEKKKGGGVAA